MSIKDSVNSCIKSIVKSKVGWAVMRPIAIVGSIAMSYRRKFENPDDEGFDYSKLLMDLTVLNGPFKGVKYPSFDSVGSAICPKLIGSYEQELHEVINSLRTKPYSIIFDVGCAEGYYAVGLAKIFPGAKVFAYDIEEKARKLCKRMAVLNDVGERVEVRSECTSEELATFKFSGPALLLIDCEGYEKKLFNESNVSNLRGCDFIIETHDFLDIEISDYLTKLFSGSHRLMRIKSVDDIQKARTYHFPHTEKLTLKEKKQVFSEGRPQIMEWLVGFSL